MWSGRAKELVVGLFDLLDQVVKRQRPGRVKSMYAAPAPKIVLPQTVQKLQKRDGVGSAAKEIRTAIRSAQLLIPVGKAVPFKELELIRVGIHASSVDRMEGAVPMTVRRLITIGNRYDADFRKTFFHGFA